MSKRFFSIVTCLALCLAIGTIGTALAEKTEIREVKDETIYVQSRISEEQAEREYLNGLFGLPVTPVEELPRMRGSASGSQFAEGSKEQKLYAALKKRVKAVVEATENGDDISTAFAFEAAEYDGVADLEDDVNAQANAMAGEISSVVRKVIQAVLYDCPYEMFWYDVTAGTKIAYDVSFKGDQLFMNITLKMRVSANYSVTGEKGTTNLKHSKIQAARTAADNAAAIVTTNTALGDYAKLTAYKDAICDLVEYNYPAAQASANGTAVYGDPWQLVWVFDGDDETTVVCEGYSKAFMYLCDNSQWNSSIQVISVSGDMWTRENENSQWGGGAHMWNLVRMNEVNYLADITNTDSGNPGLFLDGYERYDSGNDRYYYESGVYATGATREIGYSYDEETTGAFATNLLNPANTAAEPQPYLSVSKSKTVVGENVTITAGLPGAGHIRVRSLKDYFVYDYEIQEGDTGEWTVSFDEPGEYTLSVDGWSDERWNDSSIPGDITQYPDIWGPTETETTVTVSYADFPESINPGEDAVITIAPIAGATEYNVSVQPWGSIIYEIDSPQAGTFVIPAMVFADGFEGAINVSACKETEEGSEDLFWDYHEYSVAAYTGADILTISAGTYHDGLLPINLSVMNAEQVIVQEVDYDNDGQVPVPYWTTICAADNPGAAVDVTPKTRKEHQIRAAVKQNGAWSAWSPVIEATTPLHGKCNENIEWTLSDDGKLTIYGTGEIPGTYEMPDLWNEYSEEITGIEIGNGITGIDNYTFAGLANLETVTIPASLTNLGEGAFCDCTSLESVVSSDPGAAMTTHTRCYDNAIKTFSLPATLPEAGIGYAAFAYTPAFGENSPLNPDFDIPMDTGTIEDDAFYGIDATHVRMTVYELENCTIGNNAFGRCTSLRYFQMDSWGERVNYTIADNAFDGCTNLIFIGEYNEYLKQYATDHGFVYLENEGIWGNG